MCDSNLGAHPAVNRLIAVISIDCNLAFSNICFCILDVGLGLVAERERRGRDDTSVKREACGHQRASCWPSVAPFAAMSPMIKTIVLTHP